MRLAGNILFISIVVSQYSPAIYGDSITIAGTTFDDVYITESTALYIVLHPATGEIQNVLKESVAPQDVIISEDSDERARMYQAWKSARKLDETESIEPEPSSPPEVTAPPDPLEEFKYRKALYETARFEAALEHWANLPDHIRQSLVAGIQQGRNATDRFFGNRNANFNSSRSVNNGAIASNLDRIGEHATEIARHNEEEAKEVGRAYDNSSLRYYEGMYESSYFRREAQLANGYHNPYTDITVDKYSMLYDNELSKADSRASAANARHSSARSQHQNAIAGSQRAIKNLNDSNRRLGYLERSSTISASQLARRADNKISTMIALEQALSNDYAPFLRNVEVSAISTSDQKTESDVTVSTDVWRLDFQCWGASGFSIDVFENSTGRPITRLDENALPHERFEIFDDSGSFKIKINAPRNCEYEVRIYEVYD